MAEETPDNIVEEVETAAGGGAGGDPTKSVETTGEPTGEAPATGSGGVAAMARVAVGEFMAVVSAVLVRACGRGVVRLGHLFDALRPGTPAIGPDAAAISCWRRPGHRAARPARSGHTASVQSAGVRRRILDSFR